MTGLSLLSLTLILEKTTTAPKTTTKTTTTKQLPRPRGQKYHVLYILDTKIVFLGFSPCLVSFYCSSTTNNKSSLRVSQSWTSWTPLTATFCYFIAFNWWAPALFSYKMKMELWRYSVSFIYHLHWKAFSQLNAAIATC